MHEATINALRKLNLQIGDNKSKKKFNFKISRYPNLKMLGIGSFTTKEQMALDIMAKAFERMPQKIKGYVNRNVIKITDYKLSMKAKGCDFPYEVIRSVQINDFKKYMEKSKYWTETILNIKYKDGEKIITIFINTDMKLVALKINEVSPKLMYIITNSTFDNYVEFCKGYIEYDLPKE